VRRLLLAVVIVLGTIGAVEQIGGLHFDSPAQVTDAAAAENRPPSSSMPAAASSAASSSPLASPSASASRGAAVPAASPRAAVAASPSPSASTPSASSDLIAVASQADQKLALINAESDKASASLELGIPARSIAVEPGGHTALVFSSKPGESDYQVVDLWKGERQDSKRLHDNPSAAAFSTDGLRTYISLSGGNDSPPAPNTIAFLTTKNQDEFGHIDVGEQSPGVQILRRIESLAVAPGPDGDVLYAAGHLSGTVWAIDGGSGATLQQIEVGGGPIALLADTPRQRVYVLTDTTNELPALDTSTQTITHRLALPGPPSAGAVAPDGTLYIAGADDGQVWPVSPELASVGQPIVVGNQPSAVGVGLDGLRLYVATRGDQSLATVSLANRQIISRIEVGNDPVAIAVTHGPPAPETTQVPTTIPAAHATATPTIIPAATPLPQGVLPPEHLPTGVVSEPFVPAADYPVTFAFAPDGTLFYNELHTGNIRVVKNGTLLVDAFYNFKVSGQPEAGLIGLTLDPDFPENHYVYVFYTSVPEGQDNGGPNGPNEVVRLTDVGDKGAELTYILRDLPSAPIHNSGTLRFGPDGKLYVSLGDNDQGSNAQDLGTLAGKILRVNSDGSIPDDNPFVGQQGKQPAIWAYGVRNMFSFDFDPVSHQLLAAENGPGDNDELDVVAKSSNFGWPPSGYKYKPGVADPIAVMNPPIGPTGVGFYASDQIPEWQNDMFYCNYHQGQLRRVRLAPESRDRVVFEEIVKNGCSLDVATGPDGALYYSSPKGIFRLHGPAATNLLPAVSTTAAAPAATPQPTEALPSGTRPEDRDIGVSLTEWKVQSSRTTVPTGQLRFLAENTGNTAHALRVVGNGLDVSTDNVAPGESGTINVVLPPGEYRLVCPIPGHEQQGMAATLNVVGQ
jgi:glucose/arabinose dehydrogenase